MQVPFGFVQGEWRRLENSGTRVFIEDDIPVADINDLLTLMTRLRDPETGCPWDLKQSFSTIAPYTLEEACEVVEAIERRDFDNLREELGDLLFQVVFYAQMAKEEQRFGFQQIVDELVAKLVRRHPHVFPDGTLASVVTPETRLSPEQVKERWQQIKAEEKKIKKSTTETVHSALPDDLPVTLPALKKAEKIQQAAARVGFDWDIAAQVETKIREELQEVKEAADQQEGQERIAEEIGDLLFACVNYARHLKVDPEMALRQATRKFDQRFREMESCMVAEGVTFEQLSLEAMEGYWKKAKQSLKPE